MGCSAGRVLNALLKNKYTDLYGCDINETKTAMQENFPLLFNYFQDNSNRLFLGENGNFLKLLPQFKEQNFKVDFIITHGRIFDVVLQYHGREAYQYLLDLVFEIAQKGVITIQNQWDRYYLEVAENNQFKNCELILGESMYANHEHRSYIASKESSHKFLEANLFYGYFKKEVF